MDRFFDATNIGKIFLTFYVMLLKTYFLIFGFSSKNLYTTLTKGVIQELKSLDKNLRNYCFTLIIYKYIFSQNLKIKINQN